MVYVIFMWFLLVMRRVSHLMGLHSIFYFVSCSSSASIYASKAFVSSHSISRYKSVSSAKGRAVGDMQEGKSLMYTRKRSGPSTLPCGTPDNTGLTSDEAPSIATYWEQSLRKSLIQSWVLPLALHACSLSSRRSFGTLSNVSLKSNKIASVCFVRIHIGYQFVDGDD